MLTLKSSLTLFIGVLLVLVSGLFGGSIVKGQRVYATISRNSTTGSAITDPGNSTDNDFTNFTLLKVSSLLLGSDPPAWNQMIFSSPIPANTPLYIKCSFSGSLLGGDLTLAAFKGSSATLNGSTATSTAPTAITGTDGSYVSIIPSENYNAARATISPPALLGTNTANIYYAFYILPPVINNTTICSGGQAVLSVTSPNPTLTYNWYTAATGGDLVNTGTSYSPNLTANTTYYVEASDGGQFFSIRTPVTVMVNPLPTLTITQTATAITTAGTISFNATSSAASIKWYDQNGVQIATGTNPTFGPFSTPGTYTYNVTANNGTCSTTSAVTFSVYSTSACPPLSKRIYANSTTWTSVITGSVSDQNNAADGDPKTNSTLTSAIGLLGIGTVTQNLFWSSTVAAGTPATVKLGLGSGLLSLASNLSVVGIKKNGTFDPIEIGSAQIVNASLLKLLPGDNTFEFTVVPSDGTGPVAYDGIRVILGSLLSLGQTARVFDAYYQQSTPTVDCTKGDVTDIVYGVKDLGIGALTVTVGVNNAWNSVDGDVNTFATMLSGVGVLAQAREQIIFSSPSLPSDSLKIITSTGASLLGVNLLTGFSIQRYLGSAPIGPPIDNTSTLLSIKLLAGNTRAAIVLAPTPEPYDRVEILYGGVANVLTSINIHEVQRITNTKIIGSDLNDYLEVCQGTTVNLQAPSDPCTTFKWYDAPTGGNLVSTGLSLNTTGLSGLKTYYIQPVRFGCELMTRGVVTIKINTIPTATISGDATVCQSSSPIITFTGANGTAPYTFTYNINGGTNLTVVSTANTASVTVPTTATGTFVYNLVSVKDNSNTQCLQNQTGTATVIVNLQPSLAVIPAKSVCSTQSLDLTTINPADNSGTTGGTYVWSLTQGGPALSSTTVTPSVGTITYWVRYTKNTCSADQSVAVTVFAPPTTSVAGTNQNLCNSTTATLAGNSPTIGSGLWTMDSGPTLPSPPTIQFPSLYNSGITGLVPGVYVFRWTITNGPCTSSSSTVTVTVSAPPTTANAGTNQNLCAVTSTTLTGNIPVVGNGLWNAISGPNYQTGISITSPTSNLTQVTGLITGTYVFRWIIMSGVCTMSQSDVTVTVNALPTITLGTNPTYCQGSTSSSIPYSAVSSAPTTYSIIWNSAALTAGFTNVTDIALPATPINITVPALAAATTYTGSITVKNASGCVSTPTNFNIVVHPKPPTPHITAQ